MCCVKLIMSLLGFIVFGVGTFVVSIYAALLVVRDCNAMMKRFVNLFNVKVFFYFSELMVFCMHIVSTQKLCKAVDT